jgi:hypothetical protein
VGHTTDTFARAAPILAGCAPLASITLPFATEALTYKITFEICYAFGLAQIEIQEDKKELKAIEPTFRLPIYEVKEETFGTQDIAVDLYQMVEWRTSKKWW